MENDKNRNYDQKDRNPQQHKYESQMNRDNNASKNARDANSNSQHSPENGRDSNVPDSTSGSERINELDLEIGRRMEQDAENTNTIPNADNQIPNPDDFDEGDYEDSIDDSELLPNLDDEDDDSRNYRDKKKNTNRTPHN